MSFIRDFDSPRALDDCHIKKTYILTAIFTLMAIFQWYFVQAYIQYDLSGYSTSVMMIAFLMVSIFHSLPPVRHVYPYNYFFMLTTAELMIVAAGTMAIRSGYKLLIILTVATAFIFISLIIMGAILEKNMEANPFCFLTTFFLSFMSIAMLVYFHIILDTTLLPLLLNIIIVYTIVSVVIYHSMVVHSGQYRLYEDDFMLLGLLLFVDFICLFSVVMLYTQNHIKTDSYQCDCERPKCGIPQ